MKGGDYLPAGLKTMQRLIQPLLARFYLHPLRLPGYAGGTSCEAEGYLSRLVLNYSRLAVPAERGKNSNESRGANYSDH